MWENLQKRDTLVSDVSLPLLTDTLVYLRIHETFTKLFSPQKNIAVSGFRCYQLI